MPSAATASSGASADFRRIVWSMAKAGSTATTLKPSPAEGLSQHALCLWTSIIAEPEAQAIRHSLGQLVRYDSAMPVVGIFELELKSTRQGRLHVTQDRFYRAWQ